MRINIDNAPESGAASLGVANAKNPNVKIDKATGAYKAAGSFGVGASAGSLNVCVDVSGQILNDNAYGSAPGTKGKSAEDVMQDATSRDLTAQRNYMALMSNTMSKEDFARLQRDGTHPGNTAVGTSVTILDHIKAALIQGGTEVQGYTDSIAEGKLAEITGDTVLAQEMARQFGEKGLPPTDENIQAAAQAGEMAQGITPLGEGAVKYMVENDLAPSIENLYLASHSGAGDALRQGRGYFAQEVGLGDGEKPAYLAQKADSFDWDKLDTQIEKVIGAVGFEINEENMGLGRWLIEKGITLTLPHFTALKSIQGLKLPLDEQAVAAVTTAALVDAKNPLEADLLDTRTFMERARDRGTGVLSPSIPETSDSNSVAALRAQRDLAEARLALGVAASLRLLRGGIDIETIPAEELVTQLEEAEKAIKLSLVGPAIGNENNSEAAGKADIITEARYTLYHETTEKVADIRSMPAALIGRMGRHVPPQLLPEAGIPGTLNEIHATGLTLRAAYERAGESYEQIMTAPRRDMGDSIQRAFRNVDAILDDTGLALSDVNRRAVRILGLNGMDINAENIETVKEKDAQLQDILTRLQPGTVLKLIRGGHDPLALDLDALQALLHGRGDSPADSLDDYSHFLAKLDRKGKIGADERSAYIGIYRLIRRIEKSESAAIGSLLKAEMEFSLGGLMAMMNSNRRRGMDYTVDDGFGGLDALRTDEDLSALLKKITQSGQEAAAENSGPLSPAEVLELLDTNAPDESHVEWLEAQARTLNSIPDEVVRTLLDYNQPVTLHNLVAAAELLRQPANLHRRAAGYAQQAGEAELEAILTGDKERVIENLGDAESAHAAYEQLNKTMADIFARAADREEATALDIRELAGLSRQLALQAAMQTPRLEYTANGAYREERFDIPMDIDGEITAINLLLRHNGAAGGQLSCRMDTPLFGELNAQFNVDGATVGGYVFAEKAEGLKILEGNADTLYTAIQEVLTAETKIEAIHFIPGQAPALRTIDAPGHHVNNIPTEEINARMDAEPISSKELYLLAKAFIGFVQKMSR